MSEESKRQPPSDWTLNTAVYHLESRINEAVDFFKTLAAEREKSAADRLEAINKQISSAQRASDDAVNKAEMATEKRLDSVNEFRKQLSDQASTFAGKSETDVRFTAADKRLEKLESQSLTSASKGQGALQVGNVLLALVAGLASLAVVVDLFLRSVP